jgi:RNA polymerase-binding protein DksA
MKHHRQAPATAPRYRERLLAARAELIERLQSTRMALDDPQHLSDDDQAPVLHDQFVLRRLMRIDESKLRLIDAALDRLAAGEYGACLTCGGPISPRRLDAIPWAALCIRCQESQSSEEAVEAPEARLPAA